MATSEHFSDAELRCKCGCQINGTTQELVDTLEAFRAIAQAPVIIDSAYRCPEHNAAVGGAPKSEHMQGMAADIRVKGKTAAELEAIARQVPGIKGIGRSDHQAYLHIDVRETPAQWCYSDDPATFGKSIQYYPAPIVA